MSGDKLLSRFYRKLIDYLGSFQTLLSIFSINLEKVANKTTLFFLLIFIYQRDIKTCV